MLRTTGIYFIILVMILVKCFLPDEKPEIIPFPLQSVSDKGDFTFNKATLISVENEKQAMIARELTDLFTLSAGFTPEIKIQDKRANIIFRTDRELAAEHYKLNIAPSFAVHDIKIVHKKVSFTQRKPYVFCFLQQ